MREFLTDETGVVTIEWVILIGGVVGTALATLGLISGGVEDISVSMSQEFADTDVSDGFFERNAAPDATPQPESSPAEPDGAI